MWFRRFFRHVKAGFIGIKRHFAMALSSMSTIMIMLFLIGVFALFTLNLAHTTQEIEDSISLVALIDYDITNQQVQNTMKSQIEKIENVDHVIYRSKDEEFTMYCEKYPDIAEFTEAYRDENPFHDVFIVYGKSGSELKNIKPKLLEINGISEVEDGGSETYVLIKMLEAVRYAGAAIIGVFILLSVYLIYNTIKVTIATRKDEIWIMRNVGAKNGYIRAPFMVEGVIIGLFGSIIPVGTLCYGYYKLIEMTSGNLAGMINLIPFTPFTYYLAATLALIGVLVGFLGSYISVCKFLRVVR